MANPLIRETVVSVSQLQKNPSKALSAGIVRIVKNGKEMGIYMSKEEFEDFVEELLPLNPALERELKKSIAQRKKSKPISLGDLLKQKK